MMTSHATSGFVTTLHGFGSVLGQHLDSFFLINSHNSTVTAFGSCAKGWSETTRTHAQLQRYGGHTKKPTSSSHQKRQPYIFFGITGLGFQLVGVTGRRGLHTYSKPTEIPTLYFRIYVGLMFFDGPPSMALV